MSRSIVAAALLAMASASGAAAAGSPLPTGEIKVVATAEPEWKSEKLICRRQEVIGSLIQSKRVCATAANWQRSEQSAKDSLSVLTAPGAFSPNK